MRAVSSQGEIIAQGTYDYRMHEEQGYLAGRSLLRSSARSGEVVAYSYFYWDPRERTFRQTGSTSEGDQFEGTLTISSDGNTLVQEYRGVNSQGLPVVGTITNNWMDSDTIRASGRELVQGLTVLSSATIRRTSVGQKHTNCQLSDLPEVESKRSIAVLDFQVSKDLKHSDGQALADVCRDSVLESGRFILIERENIKAILDEEDFDATFDCDETKCLVNFGKKLRAQDIIHGRVNKVGNSFLITIKILDVSSAKVEGLKTAEVSGGLERALDFVRPVTCEILRRSLTAEP